MRKDKGVDSRPTEVRLPALLLNSCVTLGKSLSLSETQQQKEPKHTAAAVTIRRQAHGAPCWHAAGAESVSRAQESWKGISLPGTTQTQPVLGVSHSEFLCLFHTHALPAPTVGSRGAGGITTLARGLEQRRHPRSPVSLHLRCLAPPPAGGIHPLSCRGNLAGVTGRNKCSGPRAFIQGAPSCLVGLATEPLLLNKIFCSTSMPKMEKNPNRCLGAPGTWGNQSDVHCAGTGPAPAGQGS